MSTTEFLLKLTYQTLLDSTETFQKFVWDVNDDGTSTTRCRNLFGSSNVQVLQGSCQIRTGCFQTKNFFGYRELKFIGCCLRIFQEEKSEEREHKQVWLESGKTNSKDDGKTNHQGLFMLLYSHFSCGGSIFS